MTAATTARKKATSPRKGAKGRTNGHSNGHVHTATNGDATQEQASFDEAAPEEFVPTPKPVDDAAEPLAEAPPADGGASHPYGAGTPVYRFAPVSGAPEIVFPHISTVRPTYHFMWKIRKLDQVHQSFEWMDLAEVPDSIQERVAMLPDDDQARFFLGWFSPAVSPQQGAGPPGES